MGALAEIINTLRALLFTAQALLAEMKGYRMDFSALTAIISKLQTDVSTEVAAAIAAVKAAQAGDQSQLDAAVASLTNIDNAVTAANASLNPPATT